MAKQFNPQAERTTFRLPAHTKAQIKALCLDLDLDATDVIVHAVAELWHRELGEPERDVLAEIDELRQRLERLERQ